MENLRQNTSTVYITGAGPGDPALLTLKAKEIIEKADVIAYDNLVSKEILELALFVNPKVKLIYVGKVGSDHEKSVTQKQINKFLLELSKEYKIICRLKGGDPNVFGRGGEEAEFLKMYRVNFEIVPGVSSVTAVPAYAGIPLTHRDCTSSFTVLTAHEDPDDPESKIRWEEFDVINSTLVLLMGVKNLRKIIKKLIVLGRRQETPVAVIYWGTTSKQKTMITKLGTALEDIENKWVTAPSVIVIGEVVNYREILNWFETKPLFGKRILVTRSMEQSFSFASKLLKLGAKPLSCPIVSYEIVEKEIYNKSIINNLAAYNWIFFTSQNTVKYFFEILQKNYFDSRTLSKCKIAVVGYRTRLELEKYNVRPDFVPKRFSFKDLISELNEITNLQEKNLLLPAQIGAIHELPERINITEWGIYKANFLESLNDEVINQIKEGIDVVTFFSSNTANNFLKLLEKHCLCDSFRNVLIATIGEETAKVVKNLFGRVDIAAEPFTEDGLVNSIEKYYLERLQAAFLQEVKS